MKAILGLFLCLPLSAMAAPKVDTGEPVPVISVSVPSSSTSGNYSVGVLAVPDYSFESAFRLEEQKDGGSFSATWGSIYSSISISISVTNRYTGVYRYRSRRCINSNCSAWVYSNNISVVRTPAVPAPPSSGVKSTSGTVNVTWSKPAGVVSHYGLQKRLGSGSWSTVESNINGTSKSV